MMRLYLALILSLQLPAPSLPESIGNVLLSPPLAVLSSPVPIRPFHGKRIGQMTYFLDSAVFKEHFHNIEPHLHRRISYQPQVIQGRSSEPPAAFRVHCRRRTHPFFRGSCFDLNEHQAIKFAEYQINLAARRPKIRGEKLHALSLELFPGGSFSKFTVLQVQRFLLPAGPLAGKRPELLEHKQHFF